MLAPVYCTVGTASLRCRDGCAQPHTSDERGAFSNGVPLMCGGYSLVQAQLQTAKGDLTRTRLELEQERRRSKALQMRVSGAPEGECLPVYAIHALLGGRPRMGHGNRHS